MDGCGSPDRPAGAHLQLGPGRSKYGRPQITLPRLGEVGIRALSADRERGRRLRDTEGAAEIEAQVIDRGSLPGPN